MDIVEQFKASGLSQREFCKAHKMCDKTLRKLIRKKRNGNYPTIRPTKHLSPPQKVVHSYASDKLKRVFVIPDWQDRPDTDKTPLKTAGQHIQKTNPDYIIFGGDFGAFDSVNSFERNDSTKGRDKPSIQEDIASFRIALLEVKNNSSKAWDKAEKFFLMGNHEFRLLRFEDENPECRNAFYSQLVTMLEGHGVKVIDYRQFITIEGVDFTHIPMNAMNKPSRSKNMCWTVSQDAVRDVVHFHTHKAGVVTRAKHNGEFVRVIDCGSSMPEGYVESHAHGSLGRWWWGLVDLFIYDGHVQGWHFNPWRVLKEQYDT